MARKIHDDIDGRDNGIFGIPRDLVLIVGTTLILTFAVVVLHNIVHMKPAKPAAATPDTISCTLAVNDPRFSPPSRSTATCKDGYRYITVSEAYRIRHPEARNLAGSN